MTVTLNAANPSISQPGTYTAALRLGSDTPYRATTIPVQFTVNPPSTWGRIAGTVSGRACNGTTAPPPGATVQVTGKHGSWVLGTDAGGQYSLWLDTTNKPLTVIVSATGWKPQTATVNITAQTTTTQNFTLIKSGGCP